MSDFNDFDAKIKISYCLIDCSHKTVKHSIGTSVTEIKPVMNEKNDFEVQNESFIELFEFFGVS